MNKSVLTPGQRPDQGFRSWGAGNLRGEINFFTRYFITGIIFLFLVKPCHAQKEFYNWYFGDSAGVSFMTGSPVVFLSNTLDGPTGGWCNISDSLGNILFYSAWFDVYNRNNVEMPNGYLNGAGGSMSYIKQTIAFRQLNNLSKYYIFYNGLGGIPPGSLRYSVVDMTLDGGLGDIPAGQNGILVPGGAKAIQAVTATRHHNNHDVWVVARLQSTDSNYYSSYLVNSTGVSSTPVFGNSHLLWPENANWGVNCIKISRDGTKLAAAYDHAVEYCSFNSTTGLVTPMFLVYPPQCSNHNIMPISAEFSIDSKYLYISASGATTCPSRYFLYQYDATLTDSTQFSNSATLLCNENRCHELELAPDGKIYCSTSYEQATYPFVVYIDSLCVINNPSVVGTGCNYQKNVLSLQGRGSGFALPDYVERYYALINDTVHCLNHTVHFYSAIWPPADSIHWDFGDPASGASNNSLLPNPSHIFTGTGSYTVEMFVRHIDKRTDTTWKVINIMLKPNLGPDRIICEGDSVTFDAGFCPGANYLWKNLGTGATVGTSQTYKTGLAGTYAVYVTNPTACFGADTVQLTTSPVPSVMNNPLAKTICSGQSTNIFLISSVSGAVFHWTATLTSGNITGYSADSGLVLNQVLTNQLATAGIVTYHITPKVGSCAGSTVDFQVTVNPLDSVKVSITASGYNICAGTPVTFTATPTNGGTTPAYQWKVNGVNTGTNSAVFTYTPVNNDVVKCILTSSIIVCVASNPATSNSITMIVSPLLPVSISITPSSNPSCAGNLVTFTAFPVNGGSPPSYQWKVNGISVGTNNSVYSFTPANGDIVTCVLTSNALCATGSPATSNSVTMIVNPNLPVSVSITASENPFCAGGSVTFTATPSNGGALPQYQWKVNGVNTGANSFTYTYNPVNGDQVSCVLNSSLPCIQNNPATSNTITMTVNTSLPASVSITANPNPFCPGTTVNYTAMPVNGGAAPVYLWKVNGTNQGINSPNYSYAPQAGDSIRCILTSNLPCVTGNPASSNRIVMNSLPVPAVTFTLCFDSITTINAAAFTLKGGVPIGGVYSGPGVNSSTGVFAPSSAGTGTKTITYSYTNMYSCSALMTKNIIVQAAPTFNCGNNLTDIRDSKVYPTILIGSQCWMQKNLNYGSVIQGTAGQTDNCVSEKYCYSDDPANCTIFGGLYQWDEVMAYVNSPGSQGLCPPGWHVPTQAEWMILFNNNLTQGMAGKPLQDSIFNGFRAKESGVDYSNMVWKFQGFATIYWSSNVYGSIKALSHGMNLQNFGVSDYYSNRSNAFAVRCLKD